MSSSTTSNQRPFDSAQGRPATSDQFPSPLVAVLVVIFTVVDGELWALLIHRSAEPYRGLWAIPGGLLQAGESLQEAAVRKLEDETGVRDVFLASEVTDCTVDPGSWPSSALGGSKL